MSEIAETSSLFSDITREIKKVIVGQEHVIEHLMATLLCRGHALLEGVPGIGKTLLAKTLAHVIQGDFKRIQFTPDLMPSDVVGTQVYDMKSSSFFLKRGPIFTNILLADEINRTPPKTQSALLEAMEERQVTIEGERLPLPEIFVALATENPVEFEGTYPLPEAQLDRFMVKIVMDYPALSEERRLVEKFHMGFDPQELGELDVQMVASQEKIRACQKRLVQVTVEDRLLDYIVRIIGSTRKNMNVNLGSSPRGGICLLLFAKALAVLRGRDYLLPDDVKAAVLPVLRHRIILRPEAEIEGLTSDDILKNILSTTEVPR